MCVQNRTVKCVEDQPFDKEMSVGMKHGTNQPPQQENCQFEPKG